VALLAKTGCKPYALKRTGGCFALSMTGSMGETRLISWPGRCMKTSGCIWTTCWVHKRRMHLGKLCYIVFDKRLAQAENDFLCSVELAMDDRSDLVSIGSCVLVVLLYGQDLYALSLGDSRAILETMDDNKVLSAIQLTDSHSVDNEEERARLLCDHPDDPSTIIAGKVKGRLKLTRAFGVGYLKKVQSIYTFSS